MTEMLPLVEETYEVTVKEVKDIQSRIKELLLARHTTDKALREISKELAKTSDRVKSLGGVVNQLSRSGTHEGSLTAKLLALKEGETILLPDSLHVESGKPTLMERSVGSALTKNETLKGRKIRTERWTGYKNSGRERPSSLLAIIREKDDA